MTTAMERLAEKKTLRQSWQAALAVLVLELALAALAARTSGQWVNLGAVFWGLAWLFLGAVPGFLFGIPKVLQRTSDAEDAPAGRQGAYSQLVNTNLEQVSDWLTKILLGAGLVQLQQIPSAVMRAAEHMKGALGGDASVSFATSIIVLFTVEGFLIGYLATRLLLARAFRKADQDAISEVLSASQVQALEAVTGPDASDQEEPSKELTEAAETLAQMPLAEVRAPELVRWSTAQRLLGNTADAIRAARLAVEAYPNDVRTRLELGIALQDANETDEALQHFRLAHKQILDRGPKKLAAGVYGWLTYLCLFRPAPEGFTEAIQLGEEFLAKKLPLGDGSLLVNLAAAYGQKARHLASLGGHDDEVKQTRLRALETVKMAIGVNKGRWKDRVRDLLVKNTPGKKPGDDDLEIFEADPEFREAVGL
ncbi:hypothetical protein [Myxococcus sp. RHSTA-1-4]|uniref:hypothetical protein n=1 Tax=Myxococcus sp. RHSTA-1-4 TaxID=2874601 RepID=UPI001CBA7F1A|nr:hypothetical protein [Myxococcus sp. RHSTA-1-4]MBZ4417365.1 hypothetical protein [Myxococcus sp. RHSTA-1-4]